MRGGVKSKKLRKVEANKDAINYIGVVRGPFRGIQNDF